MATTGNPASFAPGVNATANTNGPNTASFLRSPNDIPPRTSSTMAAQHPFVPAQPPTKSALRPVPESAWLSGNMAGNANNNSNNNDILNPNNLNNNNNNTIGAKTNATRGHVRGKSSVAMAPSSFAASAVSHTALPPPDPNRYATDDFTQLSRRWTEDKDRVLMGPYDYLYGHPGKDIRSQMIKAFDAWLEVPAESLEVITRVVGMLHTASLLVDDVEDSSLLRRGIPVAHGIFGVPQTINSANYVYFCALQEAQRLRNPRAIAVFTEELLNLHRGQGMDLFWRDTLTCPTEDDYLEMVGNKTGGLFRLGVKLMQGESRSLMDCVPLVNTLGLIFQIQDDYQNLWSQDYTNNKGMCEDLTEGKFSFPVIHSVRADPASMQLLNILKQRTANEEVKRYAVAYMERTGSFEYTRRVVGVLTERARRMIDELDEGKGKGKALHKILDRLAI